MFICFQPDGTVEPFMDSLVRTKSISDMFSVQLCGIGYVDPNPDKMVGGTVVSSFVCPFSCVPLLKDVDRDKLYLPNYFSGVPNYFS